MRPHILTPRLLERAERMEHTIVSPTVVRVFAAVCGALLLLSMARSASAAPAPSAAPAVQDQLAAARDLYASARYDEALGMLNGLRTEQSLQTTDRRMLEEYRSFCLLALGRSAEAEAAIGSLINANPLYRPDEDASPRLRATFQEVRKRMLPEIAARQYAAAKATFDRKDFQEAAELFRVTTALLGDPDMDGRLADLRTLAEGFLELSAAAATPPPAPEPVAPPVPAAAPLPSVFSHEHTGVTPPVAVRQQLPPFPSGLAPRSTPLQGLLEVVVNEKGSVERATMRGSVHPAYDRTILVAAKGWRYEPATLAGRPVKFRKLIQVSVQTPK
jgi:TonB family protein